MRSGAIALTILLTALPAAGQAQEDGQAVAPPSPPELAETLPTRLTEVPGTWDLSRDGTNRRCVLTLSKDRGPAGQQVNFPAGCRRALPIVGPVAGWLFTDDAVRLVDKDVRPILLFKRRPDRRSYVATAEGGETYSFVPLDTVGMRPPEPAPSPAAALAPSLPGATSPAEDVPASTPAAVASPTTPDGPQAGIYAVDRMRVQGTCRLDFEPTGTVKLLPNCQDDGMEVFDPVRWHYEAGRLTLTAKRGHSLGLVPSGDGRWRRDPETGAILLLRRAGP